MASFVEEADIGQGDIIKLEINSKSIQMRPHYDPFLVFFVKPAF